MHTQQQDKELIKCASSSSIICLCSFHGGGKTHQLLCENDKIIVPKSLQKPSVTWYHEILCHPGENRTELTINQHLTWKGLRKTVKDRCSRCNTCQQMKCTKKKYAHLPPKEAEIVPWETLCIDLIGPY